MSSTLSPGGALRPALWGLLLAALMFSWLHNALNLVREWTASAEESDTAGRPNILLIVADDLGYNDTSVINAGGLPTPRLEELAAGGVTFSRHYADATCTPSRVAILSGRYPERSGFRPVGSEIPAEYATIAEHLRAAGYRTYLTGKWHAGEERRAGWPQNKGFEGWFGFLNQFELSPEPAAGDDAIRRPTYFNPRLRSDGGEPQVHQGHLTDLLTEHTLARIAEFRAQEQPWFIYHAFLAPHSPIQPAPRYRARFPDTPEGAYSALVTQMDDAVGRLLDAVDADNTLVVFVSDNGGTNLQRDNNYPFHGRKNEVYEGALRTPLILRWPGQLPAARRVDSVVMNVDIYPTLLAAAGAAPDTGADGVSLLPLAARDIAPPQRQRGWESYSANINSLSFSFLDAGGRWRAVSQDGMSRQLYDLAAAPQGADDVAAGNNATLAALETAFWREHWGKSLLPVSARPGAVPGSTLYEGFDTLRTPFRHGFAIGIEIGPLAAQDARSAQVLAQQGDFWELRYEPGHGLLWRMGEEELRDPHFDPHSCNAVVMTGYLQPRGHLAQRAPRSPLKLYSSGLLRDVRSDSSIELLPAGAALATPTQVNLGGRALFANMVLGAFADPYEPRVAEAFFDYYVAAHRDGSLAMADVAALDRMLCRDGEAPTTH